MASFDENRSRWNKAESWGRAGDNWSDPWGSTTAMWHSSILPRIAAWLPAATILELAPGHGRVTQFLLNHCDRYIGVDLAEACVEACQQRFAERSNATFHVSDGMSLPMIEDATDENGIDFAFSWDSLVHANPAALEGYLRALGTRLRPGAVAFLHHSNLGAFRGEDGELTVVDEADWRDQMTSAEAVRGFAKAAGLQCRSQELVQWSNEHHGDCFTVVRRPAAGESADDVQPVVYESPFMRQEISYCRILNELYGESD